MSLTRNALAPFLLVSLAFHLVFLVRWSARAPRERIPEEIPVTVLSAPQESAPHPSPAEKEAPQRPAETTAQAPKKAPSGSETLRRQPSAPMAPEDQPRDRVDVANARVIEAEPVATRPLPRLKDLLPNAVGLAVEEASGRREAPIPLTSKDPKYVSYFTLIKQVIDMEWKYPPAALQQGLEGRLHVEFVILSDGKLGGARIIRSSGYSVLDQEAMRALMAASPFPPIPPRMGKSRIDIVAGFNYTDSRLKYAPGP